MKSNKYTSLSCHVVHITTEHVTAIPNIEHCP